MAVPNTPTNFFVQQGNTDVYLSWDITSSATGYSVIRSTDGVNFSQVSTPVINNYLDSTTSVGSLYYYQIAATNLSGSSSYTTAQSAVPCLPGQLSLGELRFRSQQMADRVNSQFVTTPEWNFYINQAYYELYDLLITCWEDYYVAPKLIFTTTNEQLYDLPNGQNYAQAPAFYKMFGMDIGITQSNNGFVTLKKFDFIQRNRYVFPQITSSLLGVFNMQYRVVGGKIMFIPTPASGQIVGMWYYPRLTTLLQDTDIMDGISGWTDYVIISAAIKALVKEEQDVSVLMAEKMAMKQRIEETATNRDAGQPDKISDTRTWSERYGMYGGAGMDGSWGGN